MSNNFLKFKRLHPDAVIPSKAHNNDAGYDLIAVETGSVKYDNNDNLLYIEYKTGLSVQPPEGYHTEIFPRSSISKYDLSLCNSIGLIDNEYRGEIILRFNVLGHYIPNLKNVYKKGDKIGQLVIRKTYNIPVVEVEELEETARGTGGFGSSGK